jgi:hypothetical protein
MAFSKEAKEAFLSKIGGGSIRVLIHVPGRGPRCTGELVLQRNSQGNILEPFELSLGIISDDARVGLFYFVNCYVSDLTFNMSGSPLSYVQLLDHPDQPRLFDILTTWTPDQINRDIPFHAPSKTITELRKEVASLEQELVHLREIQKCVATINQCRDSIAALRLQLTDYL